MYTTTVLNRARARLLQQNEQNETVSQARLAQAYAQLPRLREIDRSLRGTLAKLTEAIFRNNGDPSAEVNQLREENLLLQKERQRLVAEHLPEGFLIETPNCPHCGGSGYVGSKMCTCLQRLCRQEQQRELSALLPTGRECFKNFSLEVYPDRFYPEYGTSARTLMQRNLNFCRKFAQDFHPDSMSLLFSGATGLGKTFLSACIARQVTENGHSVVYAIAGKLFADFETVKFERADPELLQDYYKCDLLIIDDLGTEMTTQFVTAALYEIVNSRLLEQKSTIISTNLNENDLESRYGGQIASRLVGSFRVIYFLGDDIRRYKKRL